MAIFAASDDVFNIAQLKHSLVGLLIACNNEKAHWEFFQCTEDVASIKL